MISVREDLLQVCDELHEVVVLLVELIDAQACELREAHIDDSL